LTAQLYVPTDSGGAQWTDSDLLHWPLPDAGEDGHAPEAPDRAPPSGAGAELEGDLVLYSAPGLLGRLDERIFKAEALDGADGDTEVHASRARLLAVTAWDGFVAADFALDCAAHVVGAAADAALPDGTSLGDVLERCRTWLDEAGDSESGFGHRVRQLAICRRLRRTGKELGDLAFSKAAGDIGADVDSLDDPEWTAIASARDAVLAAVEAVQHAALPFVTEIESRRYEHLLREGVAREVGSRTRAHLAWVPFWIAADDAAERARQAALDTGGPDGAVGELDWQGGRLVELLG
jgi:hypothetical protein